MQKKFLALTAIAFVFFSATAAALTLRTHQIEIALDDKGFAEISEKYNLKFETLPEVAEFREQARRNSSSVLAWQADYNFFFPYFGPIADKIVEKSFVTYTEETQTLGLSYSLSNRFSQIKSEEPRQTVWRIPSANLAAFESQGLIVIPENTSIKISLPQNAEITLLEPSSSIKIEDKSLFLTGVSISTFNIEYSVQKPLSGTIDFAQWFEGTFSSTPTIFIGIIVLVIVIAGYYKRKAISDKIEDYIVKHSELESTKPEEEEIDLEA